MHESTTLGALLGALGAGGAAGLFAVFGVQPQPLFWALVGSTLGLSFAAPASRLRTLAVYLCAALSCAQLGHLAADVYFDKSPLVANSTALLLAIAFHPLMLAAVNAVPLLVQAAAAWVQRKLGTAGGGGGGGDGGAK